MRRHVSAALACIFVVASTISPAAEELRADIIVCGGSLGAPAAALAAARTNPSAKVILTEPTDWLGGQATSQGVSAIDNAWHEPAATLMRDNQQEYYPADYLELMGTLRAKPTGMPGVGMATTGTAWVSRETYDPRSAAWILDRMTSSVPNLTVLKMTVVKRVASSAANDEFGSATKIDGLTLIQRAPENGYVPFAKFLSQELPDWYSATDSKDFAKTVINVMPRDPAKGIVVVDASETGDAIALSGAHYAIGREQRTEEMTDRGELPAHSESHTQATVFSFCMSDGATTDPERNLQHAWPDFEAYYSAQRDGHFGFGSHDWASIWSYRRLLASAAKPDREVASPGDVSMQNWSPGNDYPYATIYKDKTGVAVELAYWSGGLHLATLASAEQHAMAWYFFMKERKPTAWDTRYLRGDHPLNMMGTPHGLSKFPYIRDGRRIVGLSNFRVLQRYFVQTGTPGKPTSFRFYDSVGIGDYACDVHPLKGSIGVRPVAPEPAPFYIPYRAIGSANVRNLLAGCKSFASTFCSNAAYRLHPIEWAIGSAAGTAAALMSRDGKSNIAMLELQALRELQETTHRNSPIAWAAYDSAPVPAQNGDLVLNGLKGVSPGILFPIEIFHHRAVRARILRNGSQIGETAIKANGRFMFGKASITGPGTTTFTAECLSAAGAVLDTLSATVSINGPQTIVDDSDSRDFMAPRGWKTGSVQANKWASSYRVTQGAGNPDVPTAIATFRLPIEKPGTYTVCVWYPESTNRATDAPFTVHYDGGAQKRTIRVNQRIKGGKWVPLGDFAFRGNSSSECVELSNATALAGENNMVVADAVGVTPTDATQPDIQ